MANLNDIKQATLLARLSESDSRPINDLEIEWLLAQAGVTATNIIDAWMEYIATQLFTEANFIDRASAWLADLGHTAPHINDKWNAYWVAG